MLGGLETVVGIFGSLNTMADLLKILEMVAGLFRSSGFPLEIYMVVYYE